jgi:hypothetical protein
MFTAAAAVTEYAMLVSEFLPQKNASLFCVVSLDECEKVHK